MFKLDNDFLTSLGLGGLPVDEKNRLLQMIYERLEMNVGMRLAEKMTDQQLDEFESFIDRNDEAGALKWLESNFPNYKDVVAEELEKLRVEVQTAAPQILAASQPVAGGAPQAMPPVASEPMMPGVGQPPMPQYAQAQPAMPPAAAYQQPMPAQPAYAQPAQPQYAPQPMQQPAYAPQPAQPQQPAQTQQPAPTYQPAQPASDGGFDPATVAPAQPAYPQLSADPAPDPSYAQPAAPAYQPPAPTYTPAPAASVFADAEQAQAAPVASDPFNRPAQGQAVDQPQQSQSFTQPSSPQPSEQTQQFTPPPGFTPPTAA